MPALDQLEDNKQDERYSPTGGARDLYRQENDAFNDIAGNYDKTADGSQENRNIAKAKEENPLNSSFGSNPRTQKQSFIGKVKSNKKKLSIIGIGGGSLAGLAIAGIFAFMPLKLEMMIQNMTGAAAQVPAHAVEQRTEYLITRALATRMMIAANGSGSLAAGQLAFCEGGAIGCSLFLTYTSDYFEKKMDLSFEKRSNGTVKLSVNANGRDRLGSKAQSWEIKVESGIDKDGIARVTKNIDVTTNGEMKKYIKKRVANDMKTSNTISRFLARRIMMKKYGVTHWRAFEKTQQKTADLKSSFKAGIFKNTVGKISPRTAMYMGCLSGGESCAKLLRNYSTSAIDLNKIAEDKGKDSKEYKAAEKQQASIDKIKSGLSGEKPPDGSKELMSKFISKNVLKVAGGGLAVAGILDLAFMAVDGIENGALEEIGYDMQKTAAIGYAFGDDTGIVTNNDKMKAGDTDLETLGTMMSMFDGAEQSPLNSVENGSAPTLALLSSTAGAADGRVTRDCDTAEGVKPVTLEPGKVICPERQMVRDYSSSFTNNAAWKVLAPMAAAWMEYGHFFFEALNGAIGAVLNAIPGMSAAMAKAGELAMPAIEWLMSLIFDVPPMGFETSGANNYDSLSAGIRVSQNDLMAQGVGEDGKAFGGGGTVLSNSQVAAIQQEARDSDQQYYDQQSVLAKIFNPSLKGSFTQNMVAAMPTSFSSLARVPALTLASLTASPASAATQSLGVNPFNMPIYGYASNDPVLAADPTAYTAESCAASAKARDDSFAKQEGQLVATYAVADPCALEKIVVGSALQNAGITDDENSFAPLDGTSADSSDETSTGSTGDGVATGEFIWPLEQPGSTVSMSRCYIPGTFSSGHLGIDIAAAEGNKILAADSGEVTWAVGATVGLGVGNYGNALSIKHKDGLYTTYAHASKLLVREGDKVTKGQVIGLSGNTGNSSGPHLHFEVSKQSSPYLPDTSNTMNPLNYVAIPSGVPFPNGAGCQ